MNSEAIKAAKIIWEYHHMHHQLEKSDIILVLGSHDIRVVDRAVELFKEGFADTILFSGGVGRFTDSDPAFLGTTEAEKFAEKAIQSGVPKEYIMIENKSTNTGENIQFSYELVKDKKIKKIIIVQKPYMERRTFATFAKQRPGEAITFYITSPQITFEEYPNTEISTEKFINIMVGDLQRVIEYPKKGFQIHQDVPLEVLQAYEQLIALGFTESMI